MMSNDVPPTVPGRLPALDALRALGSIAVVGTHVGFWTGASLSGTWGGVLTRLNAGVAVFFVLSGFLLFRPFVLARAHGGVAPSVATYLRRRALRILPAYWVCVAVCLTVLPQSVAVSGGEWLRYLTLTQIYVPNWGRPGLTQTWSLATEAAFYVLLPLLAALALA